MREGSPMLLYLLVLWKKPNIEIFTCNLLNFRCWQQTQIKKSRINTMMKMSGWVPIPTLDCWFANSESEYRDTAQRKNKDVRIYHICKFPVILQRTGLLVMAEKKKDGHWDGDVAQRLSPYESALPPSTSQHCRSIPGTGTAIPRSTGV